MDCLGCRIANQIEPEVHVVYENEHVCCVLDIAPFNEGQNGGMFNDLSHYHMHVIPRYQNDGFRWTDPIIDHKAETRFTETREKIIKII